MRLGRHALIERYVGIQDERFVDVYGEGFAKGFDLMLGFGRCRNVNTSLQDPHCPDKVLFCIGVEVWIRACCCNLSISVRSKSLVIKE